MKFDICVISEKFLKGESTLDFSVVISEGLSYGIEINQIKVCKNEINLKEFNTPSICFLNDEEIDEYIQKQDFFKENSSEIIENEGVLCLNKNPLLILPIEGNIINVLRVAFEKIKARCNLPNIAMFRVYGKTKRGVEEILQSNNISQDYFIIQRGLFSDIYLNCGAKIGFICEDEVKISQIFAENIYSQSKLTIDETVAKMLMLGNQKLVISDAYTHGYIAKGLLDASQNIISETFDIIIKNGYVENAVDDKIYKDETDMVYQMAYQKLNEKKADVSLVVCARNLGNFTRIFIGLGGKNSIDVYNLTVEGDREELVEVAKQGSMFNLIKKLRVKDFENQ